MESAGRWTEGEGHSEAGTLAVGREWSVLCIIDPQLWDDWFNIFYVIGGCC